MDRFFITSQKVSSSHFAIGGHHACGVTGVTPPPDWRELLAGLFASPSILLKNDKKI
jgi:hypothetical protein